MPLLRETPRFTSGIRAGNGDRGHLRTAREDPLPGWRERNNVIPKSEGGPDRSRFGQVQGRIRMSDAAAIQDRNPGAGQADPGMALTWLAAGYADVKASPLLAYFQGFSFFVASWILIGFLWLAGLAWMLLPAIAGALLVGPFLAIGLYSESRRLQGRGDGVAASPLQFILVGSILMVLLLAWFRAAAIIYALFFGLKPFPGLEETVFVLFRSVEGIALLAVGSVVGGLFAALCFAVSVFSLPMLVDRDIDAFTAMGRSFSKAAHNPRLTIAWGALVTALAILGFATLMFGMILVFPVLGFATWHAYDSMFSEAA